LVFVVFGFVGFGWVDRVWCVVEMVEEFYEWVMVVSDDAWWVYVLWILMLWGIFLFEIEGLQVAVLEFLVFELVLG